MNRLKGLKEDLKVLEESFPKSHPRFRVTSASVDELSCQFLEPTEGGRKHVFLAYFIESYPASSPPIWSSESDNSVVNQALSSLETFQVNNVIHQVKHLLVQLCEWYNVPLPEECTDVKSEFSKYISSNYYYIFFSRHISPCRLLQSRRYSVPVIFNLDFNELGYWLIYELITMSKAPTTSIVFHYPNNFALDNLFIYLTVIETVIV